MRSLLLVCLLAPIALVAGCGSDDSGQRSDPDTADLPEHVVVLSPDEVGGYGPENADWTPSTVEVLEAEEVLADVVQPRPGADQILQPLTEYVRQYVGVDGDALAVNGLCDASLPWHEEWVLVSDGGACFWHAEITDGEVTEFSVNGQA